MRRPLLAALIFVSFIAAPAAARQAPPTPATGEPAKPVAKLSRPIDVTYPTGRVVIAYTLRQPVDRVEIDIFNARGEAVAGWTGGTAGPKVAEPADRFVLPEALTKPGSHAVTWDLHAGGYFGPGAPGAPSRFVPGPLVPPGPFVVQVAAGGTYATETFRVIPDVALRAGTRAAVDARFAFAMQVRGSASAASAAIRRVRALRARIEGTLGTTTDAQLAGDGRALLKRLATIEGAVEDPGSSAAGLAPVHEALVALLRERRPDEAPTGEERARYRELRAASEPQILAVTALATGSYARFERGEKQ